MGSSLTALAERLGAPVVTTLNGKGSIPESHALALGAELRLHEAREVANRSDVLLVIGAKVGEAELWGGVIDPDGSVVRVDVLGSQLQKNVASDIGLVGHAEAVVPQLLSALETVGHARSIELLQTAKIVGSETFRYVEPLTLVGAVFLALSLVSAAGLRRLERRLTQALHV